MGKINVYNDAGDICGRVGFNDNLHDFESGPCGLSLGITRLKDGRYAAIHGNRWAGGGDSGRIVDASEALQYILTYNISLLDAPKFKDLLKLKEDTIQTEME